MTIKEFSELCNCITQTLRYNDEKGWLIDTCLDGQDLFVRILDMLEIPYGC